MARVGKEQWYFCLDHRRAEPGRGCRDEVRLGPFPTRDEANRALETIDKRNREWDHDPAWKDEA